VLPVGVSGRLLRVHPGRGQAGPGHDYNDWGIADNFVDPQPVGLTANDTTIYAFANIDLSEDPVVVVEIPRGAIVGLLDDFWQRSLSDVGLPGRASTTANSTSGCNTPTAPSTYAPASA
jgi:hypothetical protein